MKIIELPISKLKTDPANVRLHDRDNIDAIKRSLAEFKQQKPIVVNSKNIVIAGNATLEAARELGWKTVKVVVSELAGKRATAYAIADNRTAELATWDDEALAAQLKELSSGNGFDFESTGFSQVDLDELLASLSTDDELTQQEARATLAEKFIVPPFSVLDARQGYWQERKRAWLALGIKGELGRGGGQIKMAMHNSRCSAKKSITGRKSASGVRLLKTATRRRHG